MALTITTFESTNWTTTTTPIVLTVTGALTGDLIVVNCGGDNASSGNVTASTISTTGGSTSAWTETEEHFAAVNQAWLNQAWATVTADGTVTVSMARTQSTGRSWGGWAALCNGHAGVGNHANLAPGSADVVSLTVQNNSAVIMLGIDWDDITVTAFTPAGATQIERAAGPDIATYACFWPGEAAGTRNYGIATNASTNFHLNVIEVLSDSSSAPAPVLNTRPGLTWQRRFKHPQILPMAPVVSGIAYDQPLNADLTFTSSEVLNTLKPQSASLSFTSSQPRAISKGLSAAVSFTSSQARAVAKIVAAATLSFTGSVTRRTATTKAAALSFTGSVSTLAVHLFTQALNASLSFTSAQTVRTGKLLTGGVSFTGSLLRRTAKNVAVATLSFTSSQTRRTGKLLAAGLSFVSSQTRRVAKSLSAAVSFTGSMTTQAVHVFTQNFSASLSFTGSLATQAVHFFTQALNASVSFTGSLTARHTFVKALTATLSFTSSMTRRTGKLVVAGLSFTGSQTKRIAKVISAAIGFTALLDRISSAIATSGTASAAQMSVPGTTPGSAGAPGSSAAAGSASTATPGSAVPPTAAGGATQGPTSTSP